MNAGQFTLGILPGLQEALTRTLDGLTPEGFDELRTAMFGEIPVSTILTMLINELALHTGHITYVRGLQRRLDKSICSLFQVSYRFKECQCNKRKKYHAKCQTTYRPLNTYCFR